MNIQTKAKIVYSLSMILILLELYLGYKIFSTGDIIYAVYTLMLAVFALPFGALLLAIDDKLSLNSEGSTQ